jgi:prevent-host-death family protein
MIKLNRIHSLTEFQRNTKEFVEQAKTTQHPLVLTVKGKAELVVQDAEAYQALLDRLEIAETSAGILKSLEEFEQGKGIPLQSAFNQLREQYGLPN